MPKRRNTEDERGPGNAKRARVGSPSEPVNLNHADYTIGWICALPKEQTVAIAMLDRKHPDLLSPANDDNVYTLGSISGHNIVIACLPKGRYGTNSAATIATKMIGSFPSIKFGLLVGIGGGIPSKVRLGDVVVSAPIDQYPGVVQWDFGKAEDGGKFRRTGSLNSPPNALLKVLSKLESEHEMQDSQIPYFLSEMKRKWPKLYPKYFWNESLRDPQDRGSEGAANEPQMRYPDIHHGLIASGNQVIKDATVRDRLDEDLDGNVLCIEMEAAGLMNDFPCLVVRGICDYADSGKNKDWQEYAAAVAAAYAKEILSVLQVCAVEHMDSVKDILSNINAELGEIRTAFTEFTSRQYTHDHQAFLNWLTPADYTLQQKDYFGQQQPGTGQWLLNSDTYRIWVDTSQQTLFCPGIPGAGKTILTSIVINDLFTKFNKDTTVGIAYLYCNFRRRDDQKLHDLLISLLKQLALGQSCLPPNAKTIFDAYKGKTQRPSLNDTKKLLQLIIASYSRVFILVDALDECQGSDGCRANLLDEIFLLQDITKANIFATSRFITGIMQRFETCKRMEIRASAEDVKRYVHGQLEGGNMEHLPSLIENKPALKDEIINGISDAVDGMFLLAKLYLDTLVDKVTIADVREAVTLLPKQMTGSGEDQRLEILNQAYEFAWERINGQKDGFRNIATRVLAWIAYAKRPLSTKDLQHALAVKVGMDELDEDAIPRVDDMVSFCAGLVTVDEKSNVIRLVHYTTQEYFDKKKRDWFPNAEKMITEACIAYLSLARYEEKYPRRDWLSDNFHQYACHHWGHHASAAGRELDNTILRFLMSGAKAYNACDKLLQGDGIPSEADLESCLVLEMWSESSESLDDIWAKRRDLLKRRYRISGHYLAVHFALENAINLLLMNGYDINGGNRVIMTPLLLALNRGHIHIAEMLLDKGVHFGFVRGVSRIYLRAAMKPENYNQGLVEKLIARGVDVGEDISIYLLIAAEFGHDAIVNLLIQKGANIETTYDSYTSMNMTLSQNEKNAGIFGVLDCDSEGLYGHRPLHQAVGNGHEAIAQLLIDEGADINAVAEYDKTPLHIAARNSDVAIIECLLKNGAEVEALDSWHMTPLLSAVNDYGFGFTSGAKAAAIDVLLRRGANIEAIDIFGHTPLLLAAERGPKKAVDLLMRRGANANAVTNGGQTPLHLATHNSDKRVVDILLERGANLEAVDNQGCTPLLHAVQIYERIKGHRLKKIQLLLEKGANINAADNEGLTPLSYELIQRWNRTKVLVDTEGDARQRYTI